MDPWGLPLLSIYKRNSRPLSLTFDETYFVLDGQIDLELYDPSNGKTSVCHLKANELCVVTKGLHHKIIKASTENRLCVI